MDTWGRYERKTTNLRTKEDTTDTVTLQADPVNRARYEAKGFTFKEYTGTPGVSPAVGPCAPGTRSTEQIFGFVEDEEKSDLDQNEIVKQATEVALRKMTGTWTQAEAEVEAAAHARGELKPPETPYAIVQGDPLEGFEKLVKEGDGAVNPSSPSGTARGTASTPRTTTRRTTTTAASSDGAGTAGSGTPAPTPTS